MNKYLIILYKTRDIYGLNYPHNKSIILLDPIYKWMILPYYIK